MVSLLFLGMSACTANQAEVQPRFQDQSTSSVSYDYYPADTNANNYAKLIIETYRAPLTKALHTAGWNLPITSNGSSVGFDAIVCPGMHLYSYSVSVSDNAILVRAGHYLTLEAAFKEILAGRGLDGVSFTGMYDGDVPLMHEDAVLVWNDEFDGSQLDFSKWTFNPKMHQTDITNSTDEHNAKVTDGTLLLRTWSEENAEKPYSTNASVTTDGTFSYKYGYLEIYALVPYEIGAWPSFWLLGSDLHKVSDYRAEVDVFEVFSSTNQFCTQLHKSISAPDFVNYTSDIHSLEEKSFSFSSFESARLKTDYHCYGFGWTPTEMYFTLDGEVYFTHDITEAGNFGTGDMSCFHDPMYIIFNNFIFTENSIMKYPPVTSGTEFPIEYRIDWVRLYQTSEFGDVYYDAIG